MPNYIPKETGATATGSGAQTFFTDVVKQVPGEKPANAYTRVNYAQTASFTKAPNHIMINATLEDTAGFRFSNSASSLRVPSLVII